MKPATEPTPIEKHWRVRELAKILGLSVQTINRRFQDRSGVRFMGTGRSTRSKRRYRVLLIPDSVVREYLSEIEQ